jgi:hypothetical protein
MTSTLDPLQLCGADDPAGVLTYARAQQAVEDDAARRVLRPAARWAAMHSVGSVVGPADGWHESCLPLGGQGCPEVAEFAVVEFAAAMGRSTESGRRYLSHAVEGFYRLNRCWARVESGELPAWRLAFIAERTICLPPAAAAFVDAKVAPFADTIGPAQLGRLIEEARARFDPERTEAERRAAAEARHFDVALTDATVSGTVRIDAEVDLADALDLEAAIAADAHQQLLLGSTESLDVRRSIAAGNLARTEQTLDLTSSTEDRPPPRQRRQVVLHVHLEQAAVLGAGGLARLNQAGGRPITAAQVRDWCANPDARVTVQPVLDRAEHLQVGSYQASARLKLQTQLRDRVCAFPFCTRPAEHCDCDHRVPADPDRADAGPTCTCNLAPCCRRHHRAKTTGGWTYATVEPGVYLWRSPLGYQFLRDHTGTLDTTPDPERLRLARTFTTHFGPADTEP